MTDLDHLYELFSELRTLPGQGMRLSEYSGRSSWPTRGVYFFEEPGETRRHSAVPRIVRVGTHAVSANSKSTLWGRLRAHKGTGSRDGNHRGSIFRLHVGAALLARDGISLPTWGEKSSASRDIRATERDQERRVSEYIGSMCVLWLNVPDAPGVASARAFIERNTIALLSNRLDPFDRPTPGWLGTFSPRKAIQVSGLWNLNYLDNQYDPRVLESISSSIGATRA
jgi:hypothetical protein